MIAMNGDPNREEVALAQRYLSRRSRKVETGQAAYGSLPWSARLRPSTAGHGGYL
jgi:hypothetical protein